MFGWRRLMKESAMINLKSGKAMEGVIYRRSGRLVTLKNVTLYDPDAHDPIPVDGDVIVDKWDIDFIQILRGG